MHLLSLQNYVIVTLAKNHSSTDQPVPLTSGKSARISAPWNLPKFCPHERLMCSHFLCCMSSCKSLESRSLGMYAG